MKVSNGETKAAERTPPLEQPQLAPQPLSASQALPRHCVVQHCLVCNQQGNQDAAVAECTGAQAGDAWQDSRWMAGSYRDNAGLVVREAERRAGGSTNKDNNQRKEQ